MKKYLTLAAVVGAIAFLSVSYLAQAEPEAGAVPAPAVAAPAPADAAPAVAVPPPADAMSVYMKDRAECDTLASAATTEGAAPTDEEKAAALKKCLIGKNHTEEEVTKLEELLHAVPPAPPAPEAPTAPPAAQ